MGRLRTLRANWPVGVMVLLMALWLRYAFGPMLAGVERWEDRTVAVRLTPSAHPNQMVYEDERVRISIGYDDFRDYLLEQIDPNEPLGVQENRVRSLTEWQQQVIASFASGESYILGSHPGDEHLIVAMLEHGQVALSDKRHNRTIHTIYVHHWGYAAGEWNTGAGRAFLFPLSPFLLDDPRFFGVTDFYS